MLATLFLIGLVPLAGGLASAVLGPMFVGGLMRGARVQALGGRFRADHAFEGFTDKPGALALVGLLYVAGIALIGVVTGLALAVPLLPLLAGAGGEAALAQNSENLGAAAGPALVVALLVSALFLVALLMAVTFAPALVMLDDKAALEAMRLSLRACLRNLLGFLLYGVAAFAMLVVAAIPLGLGLFLAWPTLAASVYAAYREIFHAQAGHG
jgi:uncharacterized membrane protein